MIGRASIQLWRCPSVNENKNNKLRKKEKHKNTTNKEKQPTKKNNKHRKRTDKEKATQNKVK